MNLRQTLAWAAIVSSGLLGCTGIDPRETGLVKYYVPDINAPLVQKPNVTNPQVLFLNGAPQDNVRTYNAWAARLKAAGYTFLGHANYTQGKTPTAAEVATRAKQVGADMAFEMSAHIENRTFNIPGTVQTGGGPSSIQTTGNVTTPYGSAHYNQTTEVNQTPTYQATNDVITVPIYSILVAFWESPRQRALNQ
jgi:hypothetical protein